MITVYEQIEIIIYYLLLGMFIGITFDIIKIITKNKKLYLKYIVEFIYWISLIYISSLYIIKNTSHYITLYVIFIFVFGIYLYYILLSTANRKNINMLIPILKKILKSTVNIVLPIELYKYIYKYITKQKKKKRAKKEELYSS